MLFCFCLECRKLKCWSHPCKNNKSQVNHKSITFFELVRQFTFQVSSVAWNLRRWPLRGDGVCFAEHRRKRYQVSFKQMRIQLKVLTFAKGQMWACVKIKNKQTRSEYRYKRILYLLTASSPCLRGGLIRQTEW